jgi:hypothetical protein
MSDTPPVIGQDPWGQDLNAYLTSLEARITLLESKGEHVYNSFAWKFSSAAPPAGATEVRLNNVNAALATQIDLRKIDLDGADRTQVFLQVSAGDIIRINDWDNAAILHRYRATGVPTMDATNVTIPVAWETGSGTLPTTGNAKVNVAFLISLVL